MAQEHDGTTFRDYTQAQQRVRDFYRENHAKQTLEFVLEKKEQYLSLNRKTMGIWEAMEALNVLVDESDPDTELSQVEHNLQTAEACRRDNRPDWFVLAGFIHDLGKVLTMFGEPQWAVVGDTFPVGCAYSDRIVYPEFFENNPDSTHPVYSTKFGIYEEGCGLDNVHLSWGHDEYLYHVCKDYLPTEALYPIRYHSFYSAHTGHDYEYLMDDTDKEMFYWVREFNQYDLYSKADEPPKVDKLRPYYEELIGKYFPKEVRW
ncbi:MAG: inositol oxygenase [Candidatus Poribacteria bacterium]|nr:inositol oxygenase [Candidatus Poribacteria bacterium]